MRQMQQKGIGLGEKDNRQGAGKTKGEITCKDDLVACKADGVTFVETPEKFRIKTKEEVQ